MIYTKVKNRFINKKSTGYSLVKGNDKSAKSTVALLRAITLENNYCIYETDKVLIVSKDKLSCNDMKSKYNNLKEEDKVISLFSLMGSKVEFVTIKELCHKYIDFNRINLENEEKITLINGIITNKIEYLHKYDLQFLLREIDWIREEEFSYKEYLNIQRKGRERRLRKESKTRKLIYFLKELYCEEVNKLNKYDEIILFQEFIKNNNKSNITHIIVDDVHRFTKSQIKLLESIYKMGEYSSFIFTLDSKVKWNMKNIDFKGKTINLKREHKDKPNIEKNISPNLYRYVNLKYRNEQNFYVENKEVCTDENLIFNENEIVKVPIYNDIAAGNPIEINEYIEGRFTLPKAWLERNKETFILSVKGDSMIGKNINDGDYIVLKQQNTANNGDIVAVNIDGEATLKILNTNGEVPKLMPANTKYEPIIIKDREVSILGVAIGIIKS